MATRQLTRLSRHFQQYCQTIRNNKTKARTPKWAVKYGLVEVQDKRGGKHQWAGRYDGEYFSELIYPCNERAHPFESTERLPDSSRNDYADADSVSSSQQNAGGWDGRGPEPSRVSGRQGKNGRSGGMHLMSPWDRTVDSDEVEGSSRAGSIRSGNGGRFDPIDNEQFFPSTAATDDRPRSVRSKKSKKGLKGLLSHRDRYENQEPASSGDRFDKMNAARGGQSSSRRQDEYQDDFERELNEGSRSAAPAASSYDEFERDGPEDAWASSRPAGAGAGARNGAQTSSKPAATTTSNGDGDRESLVFARSETLN